MRGVLQGNGASSVCVGIAAAAVFLDSHSTGENGVDSAPCPAARHHQPSPANDSPGPAGCPAPGETVADACIKLSQPPPALSLHIEQRKIQHTYFKAFSLERPAIYGWCEVSMSTKTVCRVKSRNRPILGAVSSAFWQMEESAMIDRTFPQTHDCCLLSTVSPSSSSNCWRDST